MVTTEVFENLKSLQEILVQKYELEGKNFAGDSRTEIRA